jgi:hypothetical protein
MTLRHRSMAERAQRALAADIRDALEHLRAQLPGRREIADHIRHGRRQAIEHIVDDKMFAHVLKGPFDRLGMIFDNAGRLGASQITARFRAAGKPIRVAKARVDLAAAFNFDRFDEDTQDLIRQYQDELIQQLTDDVRDTIEAAVTRGVQAGDDASAIAEEIRDSIGLTERQAAAVANFRQMLEDLDPNALSRQLRDPTYDSMVEDAIDSGEFMASDRIDEMVRAYYERYLDYRADTIARTESLRAGNLGLHEAYSQAVKSGALPDGAVTRQWQLALDERTCEICLSIPDQNPDGVGVDEAFDSIDGPVDDAPVHPSCLPGHARISAGDDVTAVSKREFDGDLVIISTTAGNRLACTPNHPVLTQAGWVAAGLLDVGGHVLSGRQSQRIGVLDPDHQDMPARIHQIADALDRVKWRPCPVPTSAEDFHGDGMDGQVAIVWADRLLWNRLFVKAATQPSAKLQFVRRNVRGSERGDPLARQSPLDFLGQRMFAAARGIVRRLHLAAALVWRHLFPSECLGLALAAASNAGLVEAPFDHRARDAELLGQGKLGLAVEIFADEIVKIERVPFSDHVFNLQTRKGWYIAEGIVVSNCRCTVDYVTDLGMVAGDTLPEDDQEEEAA